MPPLLRKQRRMPHTGPPPRPPTRQVADARFPVGKARLETIGVLGCACLMSVAAYAVVQDSSMSLYNGLVNGGGWCVVLRAPPPRSVACAPCAPPARRHAGSCQRSA